MTSPALTAPAALLTVPHEPRPVRFIARERIEGWQLKLYGIAMPRRSPREELVDATLSVAATALPQPAVSEDRHGAAFAIAHDAANVCFACVYWWQSANELHQRIFISPKDEPRALVPVSDPACGCVWELAVVDFERRAWLRDVLANPSGPDIDMYLGRRLNADV